MLVETGFHYDRRFGGIVICEPCQTRIAVEQGYIKLAHLRAQPHFLKGAGLKRVKEWLDSLQLTDKVEYPAIDDLPMAPVQGLPILEAWKCRHCSEWISINFKNSKRHLSRAHGVLADRELIGLLRCKVQTLSPQRNRVRYFTVLAESESATLRPADGGKKGEEEDGLREAFDRQAQQTLDQIEQAKEAAAVKIRSFQERRSVAVPWISSCGFDSHLDGQNRAVLFRLLRKPAANEAAVAKISEAVERVLNRIWSWCVNGSGCRLTRPMAVRLSQFSSGRTTTESAHTMRRLIGFRVALEERTRTRYFKLWADLMLFYARANAGEEKEKEEEMRALMQKTAAQDAAFHDCLAAVEAGDDVALDGAVGKFALALIQQRLPGNRFESALLSYCSLLALRDKSGGWKLPGNFNSSLSGLIYCAQLWLFGESCRLADDKNKSIACDSALELLCRRWLSNDRSTTFGILLNWRLLLFTVSRREIVSMNAIWSLDGSQVSYRGTAIRMEEITQLYRHTLARARRLLDQNLLLGAEHLPRMSASALHDAEHRVDEGWWFGLDERNAAVLQGSERRLLNYIRDDGKLRAMYLNERMGLGWQRALLDLYEHHVQEFLGLLFVLFQILPPLRGPEIMSIIVQNSEGRRNLFLKHGRVMVHTTYHKTQAQSGAHRDNVRFLSVGLGELVLDYVVYVRPLRQFFAWQRGERVAPSPYLWSAKGQPWSERGLTSVMRRACAAAEVPELSESHWRQICASIVKMKFDREQQQSLGQLMSDKNDGGDAEEDELADEETMMLMFNHSVRTHNLAYANEANMTGANVWDGLIKRAYRACLLWTQFFGLEENISGVKRKGEIAERRSSKRRALTAAAPRPARRHWTGDALLAQAKRLYGDETLRWRCEEQERAARAIACGSVEVMAVLATGMGKSLLFQLAASLPGAKTTVVVVPLIALKLDLMRRCGELGLECAIWSAERPTQAALVFMGVEMAVSEEGLQYLRQLHYREQLDRVVLDECHLIVTASRYRRAMRQSQLLRQVPVQFVYLTATLPAYVRQTLVEQHFLNEACEIRGPVRRSNVRYVILQTQCDSLLKEAVELVEEKWMTTSLADDDRALIFTRSKETAEQLAGLLHCDCYHSSSMADETRRRAILQRWRSGQHRVLVGTTSLGTGLDYPCVRLVLHVDAPYGLVDFAQESGRAGRDGQVSTSVILLSKEKEKKKEAENEESSTPDEQALREFLISRGCRRRIMDEYMDGCMGRACMTHEAACDRCLRGEAASEAEKSETESEEEAQNLKPTQAPERLLRRARLDSAELEAYIERLKTVKSQCMICRLQKRQWQHTFSNCRQVDKWKYINIKKELAGQRRPWIEKYTACFYCFQPQALCHRVETGQCEYEDLMMPAIWGVYTRYGSGWFVDHCGIELMTIKECLLWAGEQRQVWGIQGINGVMMLNEILKNMEISESESESQSESD